jgi:hypothetical protein
MGGQKTPYSASVNIAEARRDNRGSHAEESAPARWLGMEWDRTGRPHPPSDDQRQIVDTVRSIFTAFRADAAAKLDSLIAPDF